MLTLTGWKTSDFSRRLGSSCQDQQPTATLTPTIAARRAETSIPLFNENRYKHKASYVIRRGRVLSKRGLRHSVALLRHKLLLDNLTVAQAIKRFHAFQAITRACLQCLSSAELICTSRFPTEIVHAFITVPMRATCAAHVIILDLIILIIFSENNYESYH
jgi:hypothetical protein